MENDDFLFCKAMGDWFIISKILFSLRHVYTSHFSGIESNSNNG